MEEEARTKKKQSQDLKLKDVHRVWGPAEAEVIKSFLESHGISCLFRGKVVQSIIPLSSDGLGEIKIVVSEKDFDLAKKLLSNLPKTKSHKNKGID